VCSCSRVRHEAETTPTFSVAVSHLTKQVVEERVVGRPYDLLDPVTKVKGEGHIRTSLGPAAKHVHYV